MSNLYAGVRGLAAGIAGVKWGLATTIYLTGPAYTPNYEVDALFTDVPGAGILAGPFTTTNGIITATGWCTVNALTIANVVTADVVTGALFTRGVGGILVFHATEGFGQKFTGQALLINWPTPGLFRP